MNRYFLRLSFIGSQYAGWQIQQNANSIQGELNRALTVILREEITTVGCGRTDAGVHALLFYAHFETEIPIDDCNKMLTGLNALLPADIRISSIIPVDRTCHSRFSASMRTYEYFISDHPNPFLAPYTMFSYRLPDAQLMNIAAQSLLGKHDFSSFCKAHSGLSGFDCTVDRASWDMRQGVLVFTISSNRFLRGMVRAITGTMLEVGYEKLAPEQFAVIMEARDRTVAGAAAPAHGLFLTGVEYPFIEYPVISSFPV